MENHICINDEYITFNGETIPIGKIIIEKDITKAVSEVLDFIAHKIDNRPVVICGDGDAKRMVGRKLEDRLNRPVKYE